MNAQRGVFACTMLALACELCLIRGSFLAALPSLAGRDFSFRSKTAMGIVAASFCHARHLFMQAKLSAPIRKTRFTLGNARVSALASSCEYVMFSLCSMFETLFARLFMFATVILAEFSLCLNAIAAGFSLNGEDLATTHTTRPSCSFSSAFLAIAACPRCAGLNEPPKIPTRREVRNLVPLLSRSISFAYCLVAMMLGSLFERITA